MKRIIRQYSLRISYPMFSSKPILLLLTLISWTQFSCQDSNMIEPEFNSKNWSRQSLGSVSSENIYGTMMIEAIRNDGIPRLYLSTSTYISTQGIFEYQYVNQQWTRTRIDTDGVGYYAITAARCKGDGINRLYAISANGISEFTHTAAGWQISKIYHSQGSIVAVGDLRNEGFESLYIQGTGMEIGILHELRFVSGEWKNTFIDSGSFVNTAAIGDLRSEGKRNLYIGNSRSEIYEIRLDSNKWKKDKIAELSPLPKNVVHGGVHLMTLQGGQSMMGSASGKNYEIKYRNGSWSTVEFHSGLTITDISIGAGRNDRYQRIYCSALFDDLYEFSFENGAWTKTSLLKTDAPTALTAVAVGSARGDGKQRVYVLQFIGGLYEFTYQNN